MVNIKKIHRLLRININKVIETHSKNYFFINFT
ncbi:hypothetical protein PBAC_14620 [Pedobacter glucosidilyticus]|nr:hypothetical protein PBAC_14620 [Pedobacter glucosidilyticus]